jgi:hypothetical protein
MKNLQKILFASLKTLVNENLRENSCVVEQRNYNGNIVASMLTVNELNSFDRKSI